jgi:hypothetical protein
LLNSLHFLSRGFFRSGYRAYTPIEVTEEELLSHSSVNVLWVHTSAKELPALLSVQKLWPEIYGDDHRSYSF